VNYHSLFRRYRLAIAGTDLNDFDSLADSMARRRTKVLCIDDDHDSAAVISGELTKRGLEVAVAHGGPEGLLAIMEATPDLILCTLGMARMTGLEVLERLHGISRHLGRIPFILIAAHTDRHSEIKARRLGANDYVTKPIDFDHLTSIIDAKMARAGDVKRPPKPQKLNTREVEVLTLVGRGKTSVEISRRLRLSKRTIDFHIDNARAKLGAATRTEAVTRAVADGLIKP
jgi:DNA-binding NarL/FixJ family response regulator